MGIPTSDRGGIQQAIRALRADGWELSYVWDGEESTVVDSEKEAIAAVMAVDDAWLYVRKPECACGCGVNMGGVRFVMGNSPEEVINDYASNLTVLDDLIDGWIGLG